MFASIDYQDRLDDSVSSLKADGHDSLHKISGYSLESFLVGADDIRGILGVH